MRESTGRYNKEGQARAHSDAAGAWPPARHLPDLSDALTWSLLFLVDFMQPSHANA